MSCTDTASHKALEKLFVGDLEPGAQAALREHATGCESCRLAYDRLTRVAAQLEGRAASLPKDRMMSLEQQLLQRTATAEATARQAEVDSRPRQSWWARTRMWLVPAGGLALAGIAVAVLVPPSTNPDGEWQARSGGEATAFGVRAFCVAPGAPPTIVAEAAPGGTLKCAPGHAVQFTYTAPRDAKLSIAGGTLEFVQASDPQGQVSAGTDVSLPFSTPVAASWLGAPLEVKAKFVDPQSGEVLGESSVTLTP